MCSSREHIGKFFKNNFSELVLFMSHLREFEDFVFKFPEGGPRIGQVFPLPGPHKALLFDNSPHSLWGLFREMRREMSKNLKARTAL